MQQSCQTVLYYKLMTLQPAIHWSTYEQSLDESGDKELPFSQEETSSRQNRKNRIFFHSDTLKSLANNLLNFVNLLFLTT